MANTFLVCFQFFIVFATVLSLELTILHNNDMHSRFEETSKLSGTCPQKNKGLCYGGFARVAHVVRDARARAKTRAGPPVIYLNAGDTYTGTAWFTVHRWKIAAEFLNLLMPDAIVSKIILQYISLLYIISKIIEQRKIVTGDCF